MTLTYVLNVRKSLRGLWKMSNHELQTEALRNLGVDISKEAINKYALEKFGRVSETQAERDCVIADKCKTEISGKLGQHE